MHMYKFKLIKSYTYFYHVVTNIIYSGEIKQNLYEHKNKLRAY